MSDHLPGPVRWGVLGSSGFIAGLVVPALDGSPTGTVTAVATRGDGTDPTTATAVARGARLLHDYADLVTSPDVDAVYVALPNALHVEWTLAAVDAGKHVLVEKPLATTEADVERVLAAAAARGVTVMEAFMYRFHPQHARVRELVASGRIGAVRAVRSAFAFRVDDPRNIRLHADLDGGATWDVGCYATDVAHWFLDAEPTSVRSVVTRRPGASVDTSVAAVLEFADGRTATVEHSIDVGQQATYEVQGTLGSVRVEDAWAGAGATARIRVRDGAGRVVEELVPPADHYLAQVRAFERAVRTGAPPPVGAVDSLRNVRTLQAVLRAGTPATAAASAPAADLVVAR